MLVAITRPFLALLSLSPTIALSLTSPFHRHHNSISSITASAVARLGIWSAFSLAQSHGHLCRVSTSHRLQVTLNQAGTTTRTSSLKTLYLSFPTAYGKILPPVTPKTVSSSRVATGCVHASPASNLPLLKFSYFNTSCTYPSRCLFPLKLLAQTLLHVYASSPLSQALPSSRPLRTSANHLLELFRRSPCLAQTSLLAHKTLCLYHICSVIFRICRLCIHQCNLF